MRELASMAKVDGDTVRRWIWGDDYETRHQRLPHEKANWFKVLNSEK